MTYAFSETFSIQAAPNNTEHQNSPEHRSTLVSRNLTILGRRTSVRLEPEMWSALKDVAQRENATIHSICSLIALRKVSESSLTAAIRVFLLLYYRAASNEDAHLRVGHGSFEIMKRRARVDDSILLGTGSNI